jgi:hypothetical protein
MPGSSISGSERIRSGGAVPAGSGPGILARENTEPKTSMTKQDDRTEKQKQTHRLAIVARDKFMSGWGGASGGASRCAWAVHPDVNEDRVFNWVKSRSEMRNVSIVDLSTYRAPRGTAHFHIYVCDPNHPAARH